MRCESLLLDMVALDDVSLVPTPTPASTHRPMLYPILEFLNCL